MNSGQRAQRTGKNLEEFVGGWLNDVGYELATPENFFKLRELRQPIFSRQCEIGNDIYGKRRRVDFILYHPQRWPNCLVIQCKWQASPGTVDEKYPFEVLSIKMNEYKTIIVLDGGGYSKGAEQWLKAQAGKDKLLYVFDQGEFQRFASRARL